LKKSSHIARSSPEVIFFIFVTPYQK